MVTEFALRQRAIRLRLANGSINTVCQRLGRSRSWVRKWWQRFRDSGVDGLRERSRRPHGSPRRVPDEVCAAIVQVRDRLMTRRGPQARYRLAGAPTVLHQLAGLGYPRLPSLRQIERILQQSGRTCPPFRLAPETRQRDYPRPPATGSNQVHQMDLIGPRRLRGSSGLYYFVTYLDVFDYAIYVEFHRAPDTAILLEFLVRAWRRLGLPVYLQVDNDVLFGNSGRWPASLTRFVRLVLLVGVQLVFIPEGQPFRNGTVERFNGWLQERLWCLRLRGPAQVRRELAALMQVCWHEHIHPARGGRTTAQLRRGLKLRRLPARFSRQRGPLPLAVGRVHFIRRVRRSGRITVLKVKVLVGKRRRSEYVWATLCTQSQTLKIYHRATLIKQVAYPIRGA